MLNKKKDGTIFSTELSITPLRDTKGKIIAQIGISTDITKRKRVEEKIKASLKEKEVLLKEIHHRVKNNLQLISSLLDLQSEYIKDEQVLEIFNETQNRIESMALIHEILYQSKDLARIDFAEYIQNLTDSLFSSYAINFDASKLKIDIQDILLNPSTAIPGGLIINELVSNSLKHAFPATADRHTLILIQSGMAPINSALRGARATFRPENHSSLPTGRQASFCPVTVGAFYWRGKLKYKE